MTGTHEGDDAGDVFIFVLDLDGDGEFDAEPISDASEDPFR